MKEQRLEILDRTAGFFLERLLSYVFILVIVFSVFNFSRIFFNHRISSDLMVASESINAVKNPSDPFTANIIGATTAEESLIHKALAMVDYPLEYKNFTFVVVDNLPLEKNDAVLSTDAAGAIGQYMPGENRIYLKRPLLSPSLMNSLSQTLAHEIGHQLDFLYLRSVDHDRIMVIRNYPLVEWFGGSYPWGFRPSEDFAEIFTAAVTPWATFHNSRSSYKSPTEEQQRQIMDVVNSRVTAAGDMPPLTLMENQGYYQVNILLENVIIILTERWLVLLVMFCCTLDLLLRTRSKYLRCKRMAVAGYL